MHEFRKQNRIPRQAIDGFLNAPDRPQLSNRPLGRRALSRDRFRPSSGRAVDDFRRPEGYHASNRQNVGGFNQPPQQAAASSGVPPRPAARAAGSEGSLLHMTLPGGSLHEKKKHGRKGRKNKDAKPLTKRRKILRWAARSTIALLIIVLIGGGFLFAKGYLKLHKVFKGGGAAAALSADVKPELLKGEGDGRVNIMMMGKGGENHAGGDLTDTILVASVDPVNKTATLVSIPRDLWVTVPGYGSSKINAVYSSHKTRALGQNAKDTDGAEKAGVSAVQGVVSQVLGIPIHYYSMIDFEGFQKAVNTVGGVDIDVPANLAVKERLWNPVTRKNYDLNVPAGKQHFDGERALFFTRTRYTSARGDFDRSERQRLFIQSLSQKILSAGTYTNPVKINQLMSDFGDHIATDMSVNNALRLMTIGKSIGGNFISVGLADPPNNYLRTDNVNGQSVVRPTAGFGDYSQIQNFIRNTLKDPYIAKENPSIMVLNGTGTSGLATAKGDLLKTYGYNVVSVGDAPTSSYTRTTIVDMTGGKKKFTLHYIEKRFGVKSTTKLPDPAIQATGADFVIILGQDATANSQN
jgi:LCP family protein required for cell wall assembly